jgi:hypothetical protein
MMAAAGSAQAALLQYEPFSYTAGTTAASNGYTDNTTASTNSITITSGGLSYAGLAASAGNAAQEGAKTTSAISPAFTTSTPADGTAVYYSFLLNVNDNSTNATNASWSSTTARQNIFSLIGTAGNSRGAVDVKWADSTHYKVNAPGANADSATLTQGDTVLVVGRLNYVSHSGSTYTLTSDFWGNPDSSTFGGAAPAPFASGSSESTITTGINRFSLLASASGSSSLPLGLQIDEVRIGTTWADVTPAVPEPASLGLLALGGLVLARRRRA